MRNLVSLLMSVVALLPACSCAGEWPSVALPDDVQAFGVGEQLIVNGTSMRLRVFVSPRPASELAAWFHHSIGEPMVESRTQGKLVLGRKQGDYYETVQLEAAGGGTRGTVAVTSLKSAQENAHKTRSSLEHWLSRLPAGTRVATDLASRDGDRQSFYVVFVNAQTETVNRDHLVSLMADEGYRLEHEARPPDELNPEAGGPTLFFKGEGKEAMANIVRRADGRSAVVLNTVTRLEGIR